MECMESDLIIVLLTILGSWSILVTIFLHYFKDLEERIKKIEDKQVDIIFNLGILVGKKEVKN